jgi:adenosylmethionine-8-amino-7-oxononanoate aminotransferase
VAILGAVKVPAPGYWEAVQTICRRHGILLIVDEVVTGFGRTGKMFASEHWGIEPDLMTLAKGITSGYVPMGATVASRRVEEAFAGRPLLHLNTYAGHPVACEAAMAVLDVFEQEDLVARAAAAEPVIRAGLEGIAGANARVQRVSVLGMLSSIELDIGDLPDPGAELLRVRHDAYEGGLAVRAGFDGGILAVVFYPPLIATEAQLREGIDILGEVLAET